MGKILYVSSQIPKNAKVLLVDVETRYFEDTDYDRDPHIKQQVDARMELMAVGVKNLTEVGHKVYAIVDQEQNGEIFPTLKGLPHAILPFWGVSAKQMTTSSDPADMYDLEPRIAQVFDKEDVIVVAGLWRELCVFSVTRLLTKEGFNAILSLDDAICFKNSIVWSDDDCISLEQECEEAEVTIKKYEGVEVI